MKNLFIVLLALLALGVKAKAKSEIIYPDFFPEFTWDKVPVYAHFGTKEKLSDEQYAVISKYPIVCFEKYTGSRVYGGTDLAVVDIAGRLKELNPKIFTMTYQSFHTDYGKFYSSKSSMLDDDKNPHWAITDSNGNYIDSKNGVHRLYDKSQQEVRDYWVQQVEIWSTRENIDGIFLDSYSSYRDTKMARYKEKIGEEKYKLFRQGVLALRDEVKTKIASKRVVIGNGIGTTTDPVCDDFGWLETVSGGMMDHFAFLSGNTPENIAASIERITRIGKMGKIVVVKTWPTINHKTPNYAKTPQDVKDKNALESITFPLACFLCGAQKYSYICYSSAWDINDGFAIDYPEFNKRLGKPKSDYHREGFVFTREFEYASVWVDVETRQARIIWR